MIRCKEFECKDFGDRCCHGCPDQEGCTSSCQFNPADCGKSVMVGSTDLELFQSKAMVVMQTIVDLDHRKKQLEAKDKEVRGQLQKVMDEFGIKKFENDLLKITFIEPSTRKTIDFKRLKEDLPAVAEKYTKVTKVSGSVRIEVK